MKNKKMLIALSAAVLSLAMLAGCTTASALSLEEAKAIALEELELQEARFVEKEYDLDDGVYELEFEANGIEYEYHVDARTGQILRAEAEPEGSRDSASVTPGTAPATEHREFLTLDEAKAIVLADLGVSEASFRDKEYDLDDGIYELEFEIDHVEYEYDVDARTGRILNTEKDGDDRFDDDRDDRYDDDDDRVSLESTRPANEFITLDQAKAIVLADLGVSEASFRDKEYDLDDGIYELEFEIDDVEYEYDVDARTGRILNIEKDGDDHFDDDWDDRYDDDDWDDRYDDDDDWDD